MLVLGCKRRNPCGAPLRAFGRRPAPPCAVTDLASSFDAASLAGQGRAYPVCGGLEGRMRVCGLARQLNPALSPAHPWAVSVLLGGGRVALPYKWILLRPVCTARSAVALVLMRPAVLASHRQPLGRLSRWVCDGGLVAGTGTTTLRGVWPQCVDPLRHPPNLPPGACRSLLPIPLL